MFRLFGLLASCSIAIAAPAAAIAAELPPFLSGGETFATTAPACTQDAGDGEASGIRLDANGMSGTEWGCTFIEFKDARFPGTGNETGEYVALATCGDDSGITRPDMFHMSLFGGILRLTSQNDYNQASAIAMSGAGDPNSDPFEFGIINEEFTACQ